MKEIRCYICGKIAIYIEKGSIANGTKVICKHCDAPDEYNPTADSKESLEALMNLFGMK